MPKEAHNLLTSVIQFTNVRNKDALEQSLVDTLAALLTPKAIILLKPHQDQPLLEPVISIPMDACQNRLEITTEAYGERYIKPDEALKHCLDTGEMVSDITDSTPRLLFPIKTNDHVASILMVYGHTCSDNNTQLVLSLLRIYGNFAAILDDNEHDTLTGLLNRKTFDTRISSFIVDAHKEKPSTSASSPNRRKPEQGLNYWLGVIDIDHFKQINDKLGHIYGDEVLLLFSNLMKKVFRSSDLLFRYGGEEFVVVLSPINEDNAFIAFERFRKQLEQFDFPQIGQVTASIGMVKIHTQDHPTTVVEHADQALYFAKENGRNKTCNYHHLIEAGHLNEKQPTSESEIELF